MNKLLRATYRVQFRPDRFTLDDAARIVPYLERLGVSHLYASPYLQAVPGSTHGYDVVDYNQVNRELGGLPAHRRLVDALRARGLGQVLDMVPNHMAISPENPWFWDVLQNGPSSRYADSFDLEWNPPEARHADRVLVPVLGDHYGRVLESGDLKLAFDDGLFTVRYHEHVYPVDPQTLSAVLLAAAERLSGLAAAEMTFLAGAHDRLPDSESTDRANAARRYRDLEVLRGLLLRLVRENPQAGQALQAVCEAVNADPDALDALLRRQNYRLSLWKITAQELGYRRFFDINTMIATRMEDESVYRDTHALVLDWLREGALDGLRIDHPDGLRDPRGYFLRLQADAPEAWVVVEKILEQEESLCEDWPVHGTTGYDFLNRVNGLLVDPRAEESLTAFYADFTGESTDYHALVREKKLMAAREVLGSDLNRLIELFLQVCERNRRFRDYTRAEVQAVLSETAACMPVYRTYVSAERGEVSEIDAMRIGAAVECAKAGRPETDPRLFDFFRDLLLLRARGPVEDELVERFQQFTGPVMAKGVEDTTFYIYNRFLSLNEVGGSPNQFGFSTAAFHAACAETQARWPLAMLTTSTHDTKRSEDVRARLNVISEIPDVWIQAVRRWSEMAEPYRTQGTGLPDRGTEYLLWQTLVGAWPIAEVRVVRYLEKAGREAKRFTSWTAPDADYEGAVADFARAVLRDERIVADIEAFVDLVSLPGRVNSLAQTLLKLTTPGVPDLYQGSEVWNLSLVDPDNRDPVDYQRLNRLLSSLNDDSTPEQVWEGMDEGLPKLWVVRQALALRRRRPELFGPESSYTPLAVRDPAFTGPGSREHPSGEQDQESHEPEREGRFVVVTGQHSAWHSSGPQAASVQQTVQQEDDLSPALAFRRGEDVVVVAPRFFIRNQRRWKEIVVSLPPGRWRCCLSQHEVQGGDTILSTLLDRFPVALLERVDG